MKITDEELLDIIEEVTSTLGQILLTHRELTEGLLDQTQTKRSREKIDQLKKRVEDEKEKLTKSKEIQRRKRELEKIRKDHEKTPKTESVSSKLVPVTDQSGKVLGWLSRVANKRIHVLDGRGRVVSQIIQGKTFDSRGRFVGMGNQGLRLLGQSLKKTK